ncbi:MAG: TraB/GumN family protein, partial [Desulfobacteraceae bacterium]|nr:TraB/GumN family protein [Desulfobacteraceae bacterium]
MKKISVGLIFIIFCVTCGLFSISATGNKYYDANGNEVSEAEYREIVKKWRESRKKTQELKKYKESVKEYKGRYFDADGNEISEAEYRKNIRKLRDSVLKEKQKEQKKKKKKKSPTSENKIKNKKKRVVKSFKANPDTASEPDDKKPAKEQSEPPLNPLKSDEEFPEKKEKKIAVLSADTEKSVKKYPLWSTETGKNKIYFLGSIHAMKKESYPLPEVITNAYSDSETIVFEADPDQMDNPDMKAKIITIGQYANGHNLMQNISPETLDELKSKLAANGLPLAQFVKFRPWFCALAITITEFKRLGLDPKYGIDAYFFDKAKNDEKKKIFLETPEFQMNLFSKLEKNDQESLLSQTLKGLDVIGTTLSDVTESWKNGDVDKLKSVLKESFKDHPNIYDKFVIQRNKNWMQTVENLTKQDNNAMVIVGCLHLVGENSLIDL